ncbi:MAG: MGMT family protein [Deltaproteobacteria bacterium]|nr:MGMT family protein [Deltaproteobacteria bacterium]
MDQKRVSYTYDLVPWAFGEIGLVRRAGAGRSPICRILLPDAGGSMTGKIRGNFPGAVPRTGKRDELCLQIRDYLSGKAVDFALEDLDFGIVKGFARRVLLADGEIPRGRVMSYGGLAASVGVAGGARAVGNVMAGNPFPLVIPCHRVIRCDGSLGGFGGGLSMKRALLTMEGVRFDHKGRIFSEYIL